MIVDCSDNAQWARYLQQNPLLRRAEHLRPLGSHDLPVPDGRVGGRQYSLIISGQPGAGKTALLDLMGVPAEARLPAVVPGADPAADLEGLLAYGDLVAARPYHPVVESSVRDTFGPYALRLAARGVPLTEEFKVKAIRAISATYYPVEYLTAQLVADAPTRDPRREIDSLFYRYQKAGRGAAQILIGESPAAMLSLLMYQCGWFFRLISQ